MKRLLIKFADIPPDNSSMNSFDEVNGVYYLSRLSWESLIIIENQFGFLERLKKSIELKCGQCGSFSVTCRAFFYAVLPNPDPILQFHLLPTGLSDEAVDILMEDFWQLLNLITSERIVEDNECNKYIFREITESNILHTRSGELIFREEGYPLGLLYDDIFFKFKESCESCDGYIH